MQSAGALSTLDSEALRSALIEYDAATGLGASGLEFALRGFHPDRVAFSGVKINDQSEIFQPSDVRNVEALQQNIGQVSYMQAAHVLQLSYAQAARARAETVLLEIERARQCHRFLRR